MKKKIYSTFVLLLLSLCLAVPAFASPAVPSERDKYQPYDINGNWAQTEIENFVKADLIAGTIDADGDIVIRPDAEMSRAEFVVTLLRVTGLTTTKQGKKFQDVKAGVWYSDSIRIASALGIVNGKTPTKFGVNTPISRAEMATMIVKAYEVKGTIKIKTGKTKFTDVPAKSFAKPSIEKAFNTGLIGGTSKTGFSPNKFSTRAQVIVILNRAVLLEKKSPPTQDELFKVIQDTNKEELDFINAGKFKEAAEATKTHYTGYARVDAYDTFLSLIQMAEVGGTMHGEIVAEETLTLTKSSDHFAAVKSTGGKMKVKVTYGEQSFESTEKLDAVYYLKKIGGTWKIYNVVE